MSENTHEFHWLWEPYVAYGEVSVFFGNYSNELTRLALTLAAKQSQGCIPFMETDGVSKKNNVADPGNIFYLADENMIADTCLSLFTFENGDTERFCYSGESVRHMMLAKTVVTEAIQRANAVLFIADPFESFVPGDMSHEDIFHERRVFEELKEAADETGAAIVLLSDVTLPIAGDRAFKSYMRAISQRVDRGLYIKREKSGKTGQEVFKIDLVRGSNSPQKIYEDSDHS